MYTVRAATRGLAVCRPSSRSTLSMQLQFQRPIHLISRLDNHARDDTRIALSQFDATTGEYSDMTYSELLRAARTVSSALAEELNELDLGEKRVICLFPPGRDYVCSQMAVWNAGGVFVPLHWKNPKQELEYVVEDSELAAILVHPSLQHLVQDIAEAKGVPIMPITQTMEELSEAGSASGVTKTYKALNENIEETRQGMIIYTSGTTGPPKGVVSTHQNIHYQTADLVHAWEYSGSDRIPHFLPLHHMHGIVNKLLCPLWEGATVEFQSKGSDPKALWKRLAESHAQRHSNVKEERERALTIFMAVPTIYATMLEAMPNVDENVLEKGRAGAKDLRLMVSGSAALPISVLQKWEKASGHRLLERYGMTEIGMCLTNPYQPVEARHEGFVGAPLPSVRVRIVDTETEQEVEMSSGQQGELRVKGHNVFQAYWKKPEATAKEFDAEGWFKTGDIVIYDSEKESFRICGRNSVDIIKSAGYKISALDVEKVLLEHPDIVECYVMGVEDEKYGEIVAAVLRGAASGQTMDNKAWLDVIKAWCSDRMAPYKVPRLVKVVDAVPKNAMGKVNKKQLKLAFGE